MKQKKTDIYIILDGISLSVVRRRIGRGASEIIKFDSKEVAEDYANSIYSHIWIVVKVKFKDDYFQHMANNVKGVFRD